MKIVVIIPMSSHHSDAHFCTVISPYFSAHLQGAVVLKQLIHGAKLLMHAVLPACFLQIVFSPPLHQYGHGLTESYY